jgi:hypothetical protein
VLRTPAGDTAARANSRHRQIAQWMNEEDGVPRERQGRLRPHVVWLMLLFADPPRALASPLRRLMQAPGTVSPLGLIDKAHVDALG